MQASISSEKNVDIDFIVRESIEMWRKIRAAGINLEDKEKIKYLLAKTHKEHPEFCKSYPIVARYMICLGSFDATVFKKWLNRISLKPWQSEDEYFEAFTDYITMLYKSQNVRYSTKDMRIMRNNVFTMLKKEHEDYKEEVRTALKKVEESNAERRKKNAEELAEFFKKNGPVDAERIICSD